LEDGAQLGGSAACQGLHLPHAHRWCVVGASPGRDGLEGLQRSLVGVGQQSRPLGFPAGSEPLGGLQATAPPGRGHDHQRQGNGKA
jgi:hypothetical protein